MINYFKKSIARQFMLTMLFVIIIGIVGGGILTTVKYYLQEEPYEQREEVKQKQEIIGKIEDHFTMMLFHARGYFSLKLENEKIKLETEKQALLEAINDYEQFQLSKTESDFLSDLSVFLDYYHNDVLPKAIGFVENDDYESLQQLARSGATDEMNSVLSLTRMLSIESDQQTNQISDKSYRNFSILYGLTIVYIFIVFFSFGFAIRKIGKDIGSPLIHLTTASEQLVKGEEIQLQQLDRKDEIGILSRSFQQMAQSMQAKEEELMAQNEELLAQQETLEDQQNQLETSLLELNNLNNAVNKSAIVVITNKKGKIIYVNEKFCEISKYRKEEIIGQDHRVINSGYHSKEFFSDLWKTITQGRIWTGEIKNRAKDGSYYWVDTTIVPYLDDAGQPYQYITIRTDITTMKQSLREMNKTKDILSKHNELNHALSITLNKKELLDNVIKHLTKIYEFDKALLTLESTDLVAAIGVSDKQIITFSENINESLLVRLEQLRDVHVVQRIADDHEKGLEENDISCFDLYAPIFSSEGSLISLLVATRIGRGFTKDEIHEMKGILDRISLSIEKVYLYEETEKERQLNQDIINYVNDGITYIDIDGNMVQHNHKMYEIIDHISTHELEDSSFEVWSQLFEKRVLNYDGLIKFFKKAIFLESEKTLSYRYEVESPVQKIYDVYATKIYRNNQELGTLIVHRDITNEYEVDQMKSELVSTVSHELRTPLSSVLGFTELMLTRELKPERQKRYIETIHKEATRLTTLINDFLDLQRMESGRQTYNKKEVDIVHIAREVLKSFKLTAKSHVCHLTTPQPKIYIHGDEEKLVQVFTNLVSNAVKFSPDGGEIKVRFQIEEGEVIIEVMDQGLGIPEDELPKLFKKFYRIDNSDRRKIGGTGLGLAITKQIVEAHYGNIKVRSKLGVGSTFQVSLPALQSPYSREIVNEDKAANQSSIVIIEDDNSLGLLLLEELKEHGFHVRHYTDGRKAVASIMAYPPEMVVVDLMLENDFDGWRVIEELKSELATENIPIIISTALDEKEKSMAMGVEHYLTKPYPPSQLSSVVLKILLDGEQSGEVMYAQPKESEKSK